MKTCRRCKESKDINEFYRNSQQIDGRSPHCKECANSEPKAKVIDGMRKCVLCCEYFPNTTEYFKEISEKRGQLKPLSDIYAIKPCIQCLIKRGEKLKKVGKNRGNNNDARIHSWPFEPGSFCAVSQKYLTMRMV